MKPVRVAIIGGKGTAVNIAEQVNDAREHHAYPMSVLGFCIDEPGRGASVAGFPVIAGVRDAWATLRDSDVQFIFALYKPGSMAERVELLKQLNVPNERFANFTHPTAYRSSSVTLGRGNVILSQASLQHNVRLGSYNVVNSNVVIEHEATVADCAFLAAGARIGARASVGEGAFVGLSATIREDIAVGAYAFVGMASAVVRDVASRSLVFGVPATARS